MRPLALLLALVAAPAAGGESFAPMARLEVVPRMLQVAGPFVGLCDDAPFDEPTIPSFCETAAASAGFTDSFRVYWSFNDQFPGATANYESVAGDGSLDLTPTNDPLRTPYRNRLPARDHEAGSTEYHSLADNTTISVSDQDFYVGCWLASESDHQGAPISHFSASAGNYAWRMFTDNGSPNRMVWQVSNNGTTLTQATEGSIDFTTDTDWHFAYAYHDHGTEIGISIDDGTVGTTAHTTGVHDSNADFIIGDVGGTGIPWDGRVGTCVFGKDLPTAAEVTSLYNDGIPVPCRNLAALVPNLTITECWQGDELSGNRAAFIASSNDMTDNNSVLHGAGLAPRAYDAAATVAANTEYLTAPDSAAVSVTGGAAGAISVGAWFNRASNPSSVNNLVCKQASTAAADIEYCLRISGTGQSIDFIVSDGSTATTASCSALDAVTRGLGVRPRRLRP